MTDVLFRYTNDTEFFEAMTTLGIKNNPSARPEDQLQHCSTPPFTTDQGTIRMVRFTDDAQLALVPQVLTPTLLVDWRSDEEEYTNPEYTHQVTDDHGHTSTEPCFAPVIL